ncbi:hypothetical protein TrST_g1340 [Triparma strigata]|uniref:Uncharacterized protein n=1 Tax=Triparma strigata TaxID=1606541 RepID=A0A9W7BRE9_9STRA|nr:hypothetical protein TrST_g1340 [Triparma strigata]
MLPPNLKHLEVIDDEEKHLKVQPLLLRPTKPIVGGDDFRRLFVGFVMVDTLVTMRWLDRKWHKVVEKKLIEVEDEPFGEIIVHGGNDLSYDEANSTAKKERMKQVTKVVFLLNITKVGDRACANCFGYCSSLEEVDLLHTKVHGLGEDAFYNCTSLREMKVPDSLQELGYHVFYKCSKLVPSDIYINYDNEVVVTYLRCKQFGVLKGAGPDGLNQFLDQVIAKVEKLEGGRHGPGPR